MQSLDLLLKSLVDSAGSDLHLLAELPPYIRVGGHLKPIPGHQALDAQAIERMLYQIVTPEQRARFESDPHSRFELDTAYGLANVGRFRINIHKQQGNISASIRSLADHVPSLEALGLPPVVRNIIKAARGLILVTGPTGSGKTTTLAAIVEHLNQEVTSHIITIEDPIEFRHVSKKSIITQREVGAHADTVSFQNALRSALRQDPDVILIGEMRDTETMEIALTAAETGHLVFGTLHTPSAAHTISRVIDVFPAEKQPLIKTQLAGSLEAVIAQLLLPSSNGRGMVLACEILRANAAIRNSIRTHNIDAIYQTIQTSSKEGMITMDQALLRLIEQRKLRYSIAFPHIRHTSTHRQIQDATGGVTAASSDSRSFKNFSNSKITEFDFSTPLPEYQFHKRVSNLVVQPMEDDKTILDVEHS